MNTAATTATTFTLEVTIAGDTRTVAFSSPAPGACATSTKREGLAGARLGHSGVKVWPVQLIAWQNKASGEWEWNGQCDNVQGRQVAPICWFDTLDGRRVQSRGRG